MNVKLPKSFIAKNKVHVVADTLKEVNVSQLYKIGREAAEDSFTGVSPLITSQQRFIEMTKSAFIALQYTVVDTDTCIGFSISFPSELTRSCKPLSRRGITVLDKKYLNVGLGKWINQLLLGLAAEHFPFSTTRNSLTNVQGTFFVKRAGYMFTCWIPDSYQGSDGKWHDDLIVNMQSSNVQKDRKKQISEDGILRRARSNPSKFIYTKSPFKGTPYFKENVIPHETACNIRSAETNELSKLYPLLFEHAEAGEAFGLDELPSDEIFTNYFLKERTIVLLEKPASELMAVAVVGPSRICRTPDPLSCSIYMLVMPEYRNKGIGTQFMKHLFMYIKQSGYSAVLTDVLVTKVLPYRFMTRLGFSNVGCIPNSAYVAGRGYSDALVFYRKLDDISIAAKL